LGITFIITGLYGLLVLNEFWWYVLTGGDEAQQEVEQGITPSKLKEER